MNTQRIRALVSSSVVVLVGLFSMAANALATGNWVTVDEAEIVKSRIYNERGVGYFTYNDISVSQQQLMSEQFRLVINNNSHQVLNPDGLDENNNPYFNLTTLDDRNKIYFQPQRAAFFYDITLQQFVEPEPQGLTFSYDFNVNQIQLENNNWEGWVYPTRNRGVMAFAEG